MLLVTYFQLAGWRKNKVWAKVARFVREYPPSDTYDTEDKRIAHWKSQWTYLQNNLNYSFSCHFVKGLSLPGYAFECKDCLTQREKEKLTYGQTILPAAEFVKLEIPPRESLLHPIIKESSITEIYGPRGVGKTMLAQGITEAIAYNTGFAPWEAGKQVRCLYLEGEMPAQDVIERIEMFGAREGLFVYSDAYASTLGLPKANLLNDKWQEQVKEKLISLEGKFWVVDNLASLTPGMDEISKREYDPVNQFFLNLRFLGISTAFIHHSGKSGEQRGTSAKEDNVDTVIKLSYPPDYSQEDGCRFILTFEKARLRTKELTHTKQLEFQLAEDGSGNAIWTHKTVQAATKTRILQLLDEGMTQKGVAELLEVDQGYVSRVRKLAIEDKWMTKNNRLTQSGYNMVFGDKN